MCDKVASRVRKLKRKPKQKLKQKQEQKQNTTALLEKNRTKTGRTKDPQKIRFLPDSARCEAHPPPDEFA